MNTVFACGCASEDCRLYGCIRQRYSMPPIQNAPYNYPGYGVAVTRGCVCPVGAEKTCQGGGCPRQPLRPLNAKVST